MRYDLRLKLIEISMDCLHPPAGMTSGIEATSVSVWYHATGRTMVYENTSRRYLSINRNLVQLRLFSWDITYASDPHSKFRCILSAISLNRRCFAWIHPCFRSSSSILFLPDFSRVIVLHLAAVCGRGAVECSSPQVCCASSLGRGDSATFA